MRRGPLVAAIVAVLFLAGLLGFIAADAQAPSDQATLDAVCSTLDDHEHYLCSTVPPPDSTVPPTTTTVAATTTTAPAPSTTTTEPPATTTTAPDPTTSVAPSGDFVANFATPEDFYDRFVLDVHYRADDFDETAVFHGDHNLACQGPTTSRDVHVADESEIFWWCAPAGPDTGHVMTGMGAAGAGYAIVSFSPNQAFTDYSRVCIDANNTDLGGDKWWQIVAVPRDAFEANGGRLDYVSPLAQDIDTTALPMPDGSFTFQVNDSKIRAYQGQTELIFDWFRWNTTDRAQRFQHCMTDNGDGTVTLTRVVGVDNQDAPGGVRSVTVPGSLPDDAVIIFQDDTYDPPKHGSGPDQTTMHWGNVEIS